MKELIRVRVQYASRQQCCKTHKWPLPFYLLEYRDLWKNPKYHGSGRFWKTLRREKKARNRKGKIVGGEKRLEAFSVNLYK